MEESNAVLNKVSHLKWDHTVSSSSSDNTFVPLRTRLGNPVTSKWQSKAVNHFLFLIIQVSFCKLPLSHALPFTYNILTVYVGFNEQPSKFATCSTVKEKSLKWRDISGWTAEPSFFWRAVFHSQYCATEWNCLLRPLYARLFYESLENLHPND